MPGPFSISTSRGFPRNPDYREHAAKSPWRAHKDAVKKAEMENELREKVLAILAQKNVSNTFEVPEKSRESQPRAPGKFTPMEPSPLRAMTFPGSSELRWSMSRNCELIDLTGKNSTQERELIQKYALDIARDNQGKSKQVDEMEIVEYHGKELVKANKLMSSALPGADFVEGEFFAVPGALRHPDYGAIESFYCHVKKAHYEIRCENDIVLKVRDTKSTLVMRKKEPTVPTPKVRNRKKEYTLCDHVRSTEFFRGWNAFPADA